MKIIYLFISIIAITTPASALASSWSCTNNKLVRTVSVDSDAGTTNCKVNYTKETEGVPTRALWEAQNDKTYCDEKAKVFVDKLISWGWACTMDAATTTDTTAPAAPAAPAATPATPEKI